MKNHTYLFYFFKYTCFNVLGMIGLSCYILADTFFVSRGLGANGLAALNLAIPVYSLIHGSGLMIGMGAGIKYAIFKGQNNEEDACTVFTTAAKCVCVFSVLYLFIGMVFSDVIARVLGADETIFSMTKTYLLVILMFSPVFLLNNLILCFVRNDGAPQLAMAAMICGSLSNIVLDFVFIFPCQMGIFGAALATGIAPVVSLAILSTFFLKKQNRFHLVNQKNCRYIGQIVSGGFPSFVTEVSSGIVIVVFNGIILHLQGNIGVAAYGVVANLSLVVIAIYTGIAQGIQPIFSGGYGAGNHTAVQATLRYALITVTLVSALVYTGIFFGAETIAQIFNSEHDALLQIIAVRGLMFYFTGCVFAGVNIVLSAYFTSTEFARPAHIISLLRGFVLILPMAFLLSAMFQLDGVWCAFPITELTVSCIGLFFFMKHKPN